MDERSAGAVVFRKENGERKYLVLYYGGGHWGFPRGNIEEGESEKETTFREIKEETGIEDLKFIPGFREKNKWFYKRNGRTIHKEAVFFLAKTGTKEVNLSFEHSKYKWLKFEEALERLTFENTRELLKKARRFLNQRLDRWLK